MYVELTLDFRLGHCNLFIKFFKTKRKISDFYRLFQNSLRFYRFPIADIMQRIKEGKVMFNNKK